MSAAAATVLRDATGIRVTATLYGHVGFGVGDHHAGAATGRAHGTDLALRLGIAVDSVDAFIADERHRARATGIVRCDALGGTLPIERGTCDLSFAQAGAAGLRLRLNVHFRDVVGRPLTLRGEQARSARWNAVFGVWPDTMPVRALILRGHTGESDESADDLVAAGILRMPALGAARLLATMRTRGPTPDARRRARATLADFVARETRGRT